MRALHLVKKTVLLGISSLFIFNGLPSQAQTYPNKLVKIIEPAGPGSAVDNAARDLIPGLSEIFGQQVIIDNKPGANSAIGAAEAARSPADGYTLFHGNVNNALNDLLTKNTCCKLGDALEPVTRVVSVPLVMVVHPSLGVNNLKEFIQLAKTDPQRITSASGGAGSITQLLGELTKSRAGIKMTEIPYKAIGAEMPDLLGGHVMVAYLAPVVVAQHIKSGKLKALGVAGPKRITIISDVPTLAEAGLTGVEASGWNGIFVPKGTSTTIINKLFTDLNKVMSTDAYKAQAATYGYDIGSESPESFKQFLRSEIVKWDKVIKDANIKIE
jgi:tripartite-type tricarboxylate transporter receptor subunit TctC